MALSLTTGGQGGVFTLRGNTFAGSFNVSTAPIPPTLLLDTYSGSLAAAYSFRKLRNAYTGSAIRVRRSSDNTETNIGFTAAGILDTTALTTFTGAGDGFVTVWYDQSGNGLNVSQATTAAQPKIVAVGTVFTANSKTTMQFDATNDILLRTSSDAEVLAMDSHSSVFVHKVGAIWSNVYAVYQRRISNSNNPINYGPQGDPGSTVRTLYAWNGSAATYSSMKLFRSNTNVLTSTNSMGTKSIPTNPVFTIGNWTSEFTEKYIQEVIIWSTDQSSNISAINTLVNSYYSVY